jgi:hypothetical protein
MGNRAEASQRAFLEFAFPPLIFVLSLLANTMIMANSGFDSHFGSPQTVVAVSEGQLFSELDGEVVILDPVAGAYYSLDQVGATVWNAMQSPISVGALKAVILDTYEVEPETCDRDLQELLQDLHGKGLITSA